MRRRLHGIDPWRFASADDPEWHPDGDARSTFGARSRSLFDFRTLEAQDQPRVPLRVWSGRCEVFERFTDGARECVVLGQEEAYVGAGEAQTRPGHLLCRSSRSTFAWAPATGSFSSQTIPPPADGIAADTEHGRAVAFAFCCGPA